MHKQDNKSRVINSPNPTHKGRSMCLTVGSPFPSFVCVRFFLEHAEHFVSVLCLTLISYSQWLVHPNQTQTHHPHIQTCTVLLLSMRMCALFLLYSIHITSLSRCR
eukprot:854166_1